MQKQIIKVLESEPRLTKGNVQIIAYAGSGKTEYISTRIAYMIWKGIAKPESKQRNETHANLVDYCK